MNNKIFSSFRVQKYFWPSKSGMCLTTAATDSCNAVLLVILCSLEAIMHLIKRSHFSGQFLCNFSTRSGFCSLSHKFNFLWFAHELDIGVQRKNVKCDVLLSYEAIFDRDVLIFRIVLIVVSIIFVDVSIRAKYSGTKKILLITRDEIEK
jgi:hypothetical protein